jgi:transcriptional regulator
MYNLPYYKVQDKQAILEFIHQHPFAFIAGCTTESKPVATQIPVFIEEKDGKLFLTGHMMRNTDHHKAFEKNAQALVVFTGPHTYVSASWYSNPHQASTWNYMSVHLRGELTFLDEQGLIDVLKKTTLHFENYKQDSPTTFDNLSKEYTSKLMKAIVAFEIEVMEMDHVFKLSQDRDEKSFHNIMSRLQQQGGDGEYISGEMKKISSQLFNGEEISEP